MSRVFDRLREDVPDADGMSASYVRVDPQSVNRVGAAKTCSHDVHGNPGKEQRGGVGSRPESLKEGP